MEAPASKGACIKIFYNEENQAVAWVCLCLGSHPVG